MKKIIFFMCFILMQGFIFECHADTLGDPPKQITIADCNMPLEIYVGNYPCEEICPNRVKIGYGKCVLKCPKDKPLMDEFGFCNSCDDAMAFPQEQTQPCELVCPNRVKKNNMCLPVCGKGVWADKLIVSEEGGCVSFKDPVVMRVKDPSDCKKLGPDRELDGNKCKPICGKGVWADRPLRSVYGSCHSCDDAEVIKIDKLKDCKKICPNRKLVGNQCMPDCGKGVWADKPIFASSMWLGLGDGGCYSCDSSNTFWMENIEGCKACSNRIQTADGCPRKCNKEEPLMDIYDKCHSCDDIAPINLYDANACQKLCPQRILKDGICLLSDTPILSKDL